MTAKQLTAFKHRIVRVCRIHFYIALAIAVQIMAYDAWKLIQPEAVLQRWLLTGVFFVGSTLVWLLARSASIKPQFYYRIVWALITIDVLVASGFVYLTRGMASRAVLLYMVPIIVASVLRSRVALVAAAFSSMAAYTLTAVAYFVLNFNEGYKIELYGEVGFYSAFLALAALLFWASIKDSNK